jgi:hypothetical protein
MRAAAAAGDVLTFERRSSSRLLLHVSIQRGTRPPDSAQARKRKHR